MRGRGHLSCVHDTTVVASEGLVQLNEVFRHQHRLRQQPRLRRSTWSLELIWDMAIDTDPCCRRAKDTDSGHPQEHRSRSHCGLRWLQASHNRLNTLMSLDAPFFLVHKPLLLFLFDLSTMRSLCLSGARSGVQQARPAAFGCPLHAILVWEATVLFSFLFKAFGFLTFKDICHVHRAHTACCLRECEEVCQGD